MPVHSTHTALVTGASSGIGRETAEILAARGCRLVLVSRKEARLNEMRRRLETEAGVEVAVIPADLSERNAAERVYEECVRRGIEVDILINNAGEGYYGAVADMDGDRIERMIALDVTALTRLAALFGAGMRDRGHGWILNVGSVAGFAPLPGMAVYAAAKSYVRSFSLALREELRGRGVTVTCLAPGPTRTEFFAVAGAGRVGWRMMNPRAVAEAGIRGMFRGEAMVVPGILNRIATLSMRAAAPSVLGKIISTMRR